jgi:DNA-3-methyladenine glycosylase II
MTTFELVPQGPFSLAAGAAFLEGFSPAAYRGAGAGHLHLAFVPDGEEAAAGVCLRQPDGAVVGEVFGEADPDATREQVARILSLDVDGTGFPDVGRRDPVVGRLQARWPGLRPVGFFSPYEAAAWALIGHRIRIVQAARIKQRMADELGQAVDVHGDVRHAFPAPARLAALDGFPGLFARKVENLRSLGEAAAVGRLDGDRLRALPRDEALAELKRLPGIGTSRPSWSCCAGPATPTTCPCTSPACAAGPRSPTTWTNPRTASGWRSAPRPGAPTAPGSSSCSGSSWRPRQARSAAPATSAPASAAKPRAAPGQAQATRPSSEGVARPRWRGTTRTV